MERNKKTTATLPIIEVTDEQPARTCLDPKNNSTPLRKSKTDSLSIRPSKRVGWIDTSKNQLPTLNEETEEKSSSLKKSALSKNFDLTELRLKPSNALVKRKRDRVSNYKLSYNTLSKASRRSQRAKYYSSSSSGTRAGHYERKFKPEQCVQVNNQKHTNITYTSDSYYPHGYHLNQVNTTDDVFTSGAIATDILSYHVQRFVPLRRENRKSNIIRQTRFKRPKIVREKLTSEQYVYVSFWLWDLTLIDIHE